MKRGARKVRKAAWLSAGLAACLAVVLAGCGGGSGAPANGGDAGVDQAADLGVDGSADLAAVDRSTDRGDDRIAAGDVPTGGDAPPNIDQSTPDASTGDAADAPMTGVPEDPNSVATPVGRTVATDLAAATAFLYTGSNPIQTGVAPGTIQPTLAAVLRGKVTDRQGAALSSVTITILGHPELGQTLTRDDGAFDLAVNGGGRLTVRYQKDGLLSVQRAVLAPWRDYAWLPDVVMIAFDSAVTAIDLGAAGMQVARGSAVSDADGARQATVLVPPGTTADMARPDGTHAALTTLHMRATEYTVGASGPSAMPAPLPASSGYTYAAELSIDEAVAAGATEVRFNQPLPVYVENFVGFAAGTDVPAGYYDRQLGRWIPSANGRVLTVLGATAGVADLDIDGDGAAEGDTALTALGITAAERTQLARLYPTAGQSLWRVPVTHFSPWDYNWPYGPPPDAIPPPPPRLRPVLDHPNEECGSIIGCEDQTLGESVPIVGTPWSLNYRSGRTPGHKDGNTLLIPVSGPDPLPPSLSEIRVDVSIAGRLYEKLLAPASNLTYPLSWDGKDAYGRTLQGLQHAFITLSYDYLPVYYNTFQGFANSFGVAGAAGASLAPSRNSSRISFSRSWTEDVGQWDARGFELGGWSLDVNHAYEFSLSRLLLGDGTQRSAAVLPAVITTVAGKEGAGFSGDGGPAGAAALRGPAGVAIAPDGSLTIADTINHRIRRVGPDGVITTITGTGTPAFSGDGGPALGSAVYAPRAVALGPDGSTYIADSNNFRVRRIGPDGIITTVAGTGTKGFSGDGGPAIAATIDQIYSLAVGPDGSLFVADTINNRVRQISPDGLIRTVAGTGVAGGLGDGGRATAATLSFPEGVLVGPDGSLYISDLGNHRVRRVRPDGIIATIAGNGTTGQPSGSGGPAVMATLGQPLGLALAADGGLYVADAGGNVRLIAPDGTIQVIAGGPQGITDDGTGFSPSGLAIAPDGNLYIADATDRIHRVGSPLPGVVLSRADRLLPSADGREIYVFDTTGRHLETLDALTGAARLQFAYDGAGRLTSVTDLAGSVTTIERLNGAPTAIIAPGGQRTALVTNSDGWLTSVTNPAGEAHTASYTADGLLETFVDPKGHVHTLTYDDLGRLVKDQDPAGGSTTLARSEQPGGYTVTTTSALGRGHVYQIQRVADGTTRSSVTQPGGATAVTVIGNDGSEETTHGNGSVTSVSYGPDPRWGKVAPIARTIVATTPGGLTRTITTARATVLSDPLNPLSLTRQTDTIVDNGLTRQQVYDAATRTFTLTTAEGRTSSMTLDALGRAVSYVPGNGIAAVTRGYNAAGQLASEAHGTQSLALAYDAKRRLISVQDAAHHVVAYDYDAADRITKVTLPSARSYAVTYDADGNATAVVTPGAAAHALGATARDEEQSYTPPGSATSQAWSYDVDGRWTATTLPSQRGLGASYAAAGRPSGLAYADASVSFGYADGTDRISQMSRAPQSGTAHAAALSYDAELVTALTTTGAAQGRYAMTYDNRLLLSALDLSSGADSASLAFAHDQDGLLTGYGPFTLTRLGPGGLPSQISDGALTIAISYDGVGRPASRRHTVMGTVVYQIDFTYDSGGRISRRVETVGGVASTSDYSYDADGQLMQVARGGAAIESYGYDGDGNRTTPAAAYDAQDRLTSLGAVTYQLDADGFLVGRGSDTFQLSVRWELLGATVGGQAITYDSDALGRRVRRTRAGSAQEYLYGNPGYPLQITASRDPANGLTVFYYDSTGRLIGLERGGARYYVATDQAGTPRVVSDATGAVVKTVSHDSFGKLLADSNPSFDLPIGFAGGLGDDATGLVRFGFRDYDPAAGRWIARDPTLFHGGDFNLYSYATNDPVNTVDATGLWTSGVSAYDGFGGGVSLTSDSSGFKICVEVGIGLGAGVEIDPLGEVGDINPSLSGLAEASVKLGPAAKIGAGIEIGKGHGPCPGFSAKEKLSLSVGPGSVTATFADGDFKGAKAKAKIPDLSVGASAKAAAKGCVGRLW